MNKKNVLLLENIDKGAKALFEKAGYRVQALQYALADDTTIDLSDIQILGIRSKTQVTKRFLQKAKNLEVIGAFCIGTDQIDLVACKKKRVTVFNAPFSNTRSVAELAIAEMILLMRNIFERSLEMHHGIWNKSAQGSFEIRGKVLGIIGYGNIGTQLSVLAEAFGMKVVYYDIAEKLFYGNAKKCRNLKELLHIADVISIHIDGRAENTNFIGEKDFREMKDGVIVLNLSRGKVVDLVALSDFIKLGKVRGAAVDVFPQEPEKNGGDFITPLQNLSNVILTPHIAGSTQEAQEHIAHFVSEQIIGYLRKEEVVLSL